MSTIRQRTFPQKIKIPCKNHRNLPAQDIKKQLCTNCLAMEEQGKTLAKRAAPGGTAGKRR